MDDKIIINTERLEIYRDLSKKINLWDRDYSSIKKDLESIKQRLIFMDAAYDFSGVFTEKCLLAMRLLTYGESYEALRVSDIMAILTPLTDMSHLTPQSVPLNSDMAIEFAIRGVPVAYRLIKNAKNEEDSSITNEYELRVALRETVIKNATLTKYILGMSIALDFCLASYGMADIRDRMIDQVEYILRKNINKHIEECLAGADKISNEIFRYKDLKPPRFAMLMSVLLIECNLGNIGYRLAADIIMNMRDGIVKRGHKDDFLNFLDNKGFQAMVKYAMKFHDIGENNDDKKE